MMADAPSASRHQLGTTNHQVEFVFQVQSLLFELFRINIGGGFDAFLDPVNLLIHGVVLVEEASKVAVASLQIVNGFLVIGEFMQQAVVFNHHELTLLVVGCVMIKRFCVHRIDMHQVYLSAKQMNSSVTQAL